MNPEKKPPLRGGFQMEPYGIQPGAGDMIGAFVGRECRGVGTMEEGTFSPLTVYYQKAGEPVALRYYDAAKKKIITFTTTFKPE